MSNAIFVPPRGIVLVLSGPEAKAVFSALSETLDATDDIEQKGIFGTLVRAAMAQDVMDQISKALGS